METLNTTDFVKQVKALGYRVTVYTTHLRVEEANGTYLCTINSESPMMVAMAYAKSPSKALFNLITTYAKTPIPQRESQTVTGSDIS